jgi:hypothetical protein
VLAVVAHTLMFVHSGPGDLHSDVRVDFDSERIAEAQQVAAAVAALVRTWVAAAVEVVAALLERMRGRRSKPRLQCPKPRELASGSQLQELFVAAELGQSRDFQVSKQEPVHC